MINKLFNLRTAQDHQQLYLLSFLLLLAATTFTMDISFLPVFILYLLALTWALLLHHLVGENMRDPERPDAQRLPGLTWSFFLSTNGIAIMAVGCTLILFALMPVWDPARNRY